MADPREYAGYRRHSRARSTGTTVVLVDGNAQGIGSPDDGDGRWFLICDQHDTILSAGEDGRQADLIPFMAAPEEWCQDCQAAADIDPKEGS